MTVLQWNQILDTVSLAKTRCFTARKVRARSVGTMLQIAVGAPQPRGLANAPDSFIRELSGRAGSQPDPAGDDELSDEELADTLTAQLRRLRDQLAPARGRTRHSLAPGELSEEEVDRVLFPLAIYFDQLIALRADDGLPLRNAADALESVALVQETLFHIDDGGERFYSALEEALNERAAPGLLLEVYYFCLKDGFLGRYEADAQARQDCLTQLAQRLTDLPISLSTELPERAVRSARAAFPVRYYGRAATCALAAFCLLMAASQLESWFVRARLHARASVDGATLGPLDEVRPLREVMRTATPCEESVPVGK